MGTYFLKFYMYEAQEADKAPRQPMSKEKHDEMKHAISSEMKNITYKEYLDLLSEENAKREKLVYQVGKWVFGNDKEFQDFDTKRIPGFVRWLDKMVENDYSHIR